MQIIVMTSNHTDHLLKGFFYLWNKYSNVNLDADIVVCGYKEPLFDIDFNFLRPRFYSIGNMDNYPVSKWSDSFLKVLDNVADEVFMFMMDDFWPVRPMDTKALNMMYHYMLQFRYVLKMDVAFERLHAAGSNTNYNTLGHLDLVKSDHASAYHMSLWGGFFNRDLLKKFIVPNETAQQIEINGTRRLQQVGDDVIVLGTQQGPLKHANVYQRGEWNTDFYASGLPTLKKEDRKELKELGYL